MVRLVRTRRAGLEFLPWADGLGRVHRSGDQPIRVLVFGGGAARGVGIRTHDLGIGAGIADALVKWTGRGVTVDIIDELDPVSRDALVALDAARLDRYDAIVVTLSAATAWELRSPARWQRELTELIGIITTRAKPAAAIMVTGWRRLAQITGMNRILGPVVRSWDIRLNIVTEQVLEDASRPVQMLEPPKKLQRGSSLGAAAVYSTWGAEIGKQLSLRFIQAAPPEMQIAATRNRPDAEPDRQAAVVASKLRDAVGDRRLTHLVRLARMQYGTSHAEVNLIDGEWQRTIAAAGHTARPVRRSDGICPITIEHDDALVLLDAENDPRITGMPLTPGGEPIRFYAGVPIESPDGYRIGALCVYDEALRPGTRIDTSALKTLAADVEKRVWELMQDRGTSTQVIGASPAPDLGL